MLEESGYRVLDAEDGVAAWELLQQRVDDVALVLTDLEMPNMDGFELVRRIKSDARCAHLPVIALTTLADNADLEKGEKAGIAEYHIKLDKEELLRAIGTLLGQTDAG